MVSKMVSYYTGTFLTMAAFIEAMCFHKMRASFFGLWQVRGLKIGLIKYKLHQVFVLFGKLH